jgi:hypothetical protein
VEREEVSVCQNRHGILLYCEKCGTKAVMLPMETAASIAGITLRALYRSLEEDKLHCIELPDGTVLICAESFKTLT